MTAPRRLAGLALGLAAVLFLAATVSSKALRLWTAGFSAYDLGMHAVAMWKTAFLRDPFNYVRGMNTLGDHVWIVNYLVAPLYRLAPRIETLFLLQSLAHAACAPLVGLFALRVTRSAWLAAGLGTAAVLHPALWNMNLESYHPETLAVPLLFACFASAYLRRWRAFWLLFAVSLTTKEDVSITLGVLGVWILLFRSRAAGAAAVVLAGLWLAFAIKVVLPLNNDGAGFFRTEGGYWFSALKGRPGDALVVLDRVFSGRAWRYALDLLGPLGPLALLRPDVLLVAAPSFAVNCVTNNPYLMSIDYHYNNQTLPFLWAAQVLGAKALCNALFSGRLAFRHAKHAALALAAVAGAAWHQTRRSQLPLTRIAESVRRAATWQSDRHREELDLVRALFTARPGVVVSATHNLVPEFADRDVVYMFPNPWHSELWGVAGEYPASLPAVDYLVVEKYASLAAAGPELERTMTPLWTGDHLVVYGRKR